MGRGGRHRSRRAAIGVIGVAIVACGGSRQPPADPVAQADRITVDELASGKLDALPTGAQFIRVLGFHQAPGGSFPSRKHQPGIIYQGVGGQNLAYADGQHTDILAGQAVFLRSAAHSHDNAGTSDNRWYFFAVLPREQRGAPLVVASSQVAFETEDLPSGVLPPGSYVETLRRATLQPGGRSAAHRFGGNEVVIVLDGQLTLDAVGRTAVQLSAGQGAYVAPGTATQELASGSAAVTYLAFVVTRLGVPFEVDVPTVPSG